MEEKDLDLQDAIEYVIQMLNDRVKEYCALKRRLPSFDRSVDKELARYLRALEHFVQGTVVWYYSPRKSFSWVYILEIEANPSSTNPPQGISATSMCLKREIY
jgi:hypothetical protein